MAKLDKNQLIESLKEMTIMDIDEIIKAVEEAFGVSATPVVAAGAVGGTQEAASEVTVKVTGYADNAKLAVLKLYREIAGVGLMEAKTAVEKLPCVVKQDIKPEEAEELKKRFVEVGATVEIK